MQFPDPLARGTLVRRYRRFLADVALDCGTTVVAHCPNPGSMLGLATPGMAVWLAPATGRGRLDWRWELTELACGTLVGIHAARANAVFEAALAADAVPELGGYATRRREVRYGAGSRVDFLLEDSGRPPCHVEIKNVHLCRDGCTAEFPDSVTRRGTRHLRALAGVVAAGGRAVLAYLVQRDDCTSFRLAADIDPGYAAAFGAACAAGVETLCYACRVTTAGVALARPLPIAASP